MEAFHADAIRQLMRTHRLGQPLFYWPEVDSTNAALLRLIKEAGASEGTVVVADAQTAGRGRLGKPWFSPPGVNLYLSILLTPAIPLRDARFLTLIGSLAIADALEAEGVTAQVKWPNDVLVADKKIAGVLAELQAERGSIEYLILGIGVNLNIDRASMNRFLGDAASGATSLQEALGHARNRAAFAALLIEKLEQRYDRFLSTGKTALIAEWKHRSFLGRRVSVREEDMQVEGVAMDLDEEGCLTVTLDDGSSVCVREGEVIPLQAS